MTKLLIGLLMIGTVTAFAECNESFEQKYRVKDKCGKILAKRSSSLSDKIYLTLDSHPQITLVGLDHVSIALKAYDMDDSICIGKLTRKFGSYCGREVYLE